MAAHQTQAETISNLSCILPALPYAFFCYLCPLLTYSLLHIFPQLLHPHHPSNGMSSVLNSQKHPTVIHMQHLYKINQLHGIRVLLQKLTVAHLLKEFPTFHENQISLLNHINPAYRSTMTECN